jgi:hypothetical protein
MKLETKMRNAECGMRGPEGSQVWALPLIRPTGTFSPKWAKGGARFEPHGQVTPYLSQTEFNPFKPILTAFNRFKPILTCFLKKLCEAHGRPIGIPNSASGFGGGFQRFFQTIGNDSNRFQ